MSESVRPRLRALRLPERGMKEARREGVDLVDALAFIGVRPRACLGALRHRHVGAIGEIPDGVHEFHPLHLHDEVDDGAALMATKAIIQLGIDIDAERRRLFIMERTAAPKPPPLLFERNVFGDDFLERRPKFQFVQPCIHQSTGHFVTLRFLAR